MMNNRVTCSSISLKKEIYKKIFRALERHHLTTLKPHSRIFSLFLCFFWVKYKNITRNCANTKTNLTHPPLRAY